MTCVVLYSNFESLSYATLLSKENITFEIAARAMMGLVDVSIMVLMVYLLLRHCQSELKRTKRLVFWLIVLTVNTGVWTALAAIVELVLILVYRDGLQFCVIEYSLSLLYLNALLANFNSREDTSPTDGQGGEISLSLAWISRHSTGTGLPTSNCLCSGSNNIGGGGLCHMHASVELHDDCL
ncbi:hypothetical protein BD413DRAFT_597521 [Trametes elegans]|nr:hypothetical protein BD413DRAFT_597521 [Trametes elegans]